MAATRSSLSRRAAWGDARKPRRSARRMARTWTWNYAPSACPSTCCWNASRATWTVYASACSCDAVCSAISIGSATGPSPRSRPSFPRRMQSQSRREPLYRLGCEFTRIHRCDTRRTTSESNIHTASSAHYSRLTAIFKSRYFDVKIKSGTGALIGCKLRPRTNRYFQREHRHVSRSIFFNSVLYLKSSKYNFKILQTNYRIILLSHDWVYDKNSIP